MAHRIEDIPRLYFALLLLFAIVNNVSAQHKWERLCEGEETAKRFGDIALDPDWNFIWPMSTVEGIFFIHAGLKQLYSSAKEFKTFKIVEPYISQGRLSTEGVSAFNYISYENAHMHFIGRSEFAKLTGFDRKEFSHRPGDMKDIIMFRLKPANKGEPSQCKTMKDTCICYSIVRSPQARHAMRSIHVEFQEDKVFNNGLLSTLFLLVRSSEYAKESGVTTNFPITIGLEHWYHGFHAPGSTTEADFGIKVSPYMAEAAKKVMQVTESKGESTAVSWRVEHHFNDAMRRIGRHEINAASYTIGCEIENILANLKAPKQAPLVLLFDLFADLLPAGEERMKRFRSPPAPLKREIISIFRRYYDKLIAIEVLFKKYRLQIDPKKYSADDPDTFLSWLSVAVGAETSTFYDTGGHFSNLVSEYRHNKGLRKLDFETECHNSLQDNVVATDDIIKLWVK